MPFKTRSEKCMIDIGGSSLSSAPTDSYLELYFLSFTNASEESIFLEINNHRSVRKSEMLTLSQAGG